MTMSDLKISISEWLEDIDNFSERVREKWRHIRGFEEPLLIIPYLGYGTADKFLLRGRVLENKGEFSVRQSDSRGRNLVNLFKRFATDEVPNARVCARYKDVEQEVQTDREGYFYLEMNAAGAALENAMYEEIELELLEPVKGAGAKAHATGRVLVPPETAKYGVISDLDDTVITTNVTSRLKMLLTVALLNEYTRVPFKGVSAFYKALQKGAGGADNNPIFYVSSSPWNLYEPLMEFLRVQNIPQGPLFLKDFGNHTIFESSEHKKHKIENIELILNTYPQLPFVLIGDSGEQDPEIYSEIVHRYPSRIRVIYIRSVNVNPERLASIDRLISAIAVTGCQLVLAPDTEFAAVHAAAENLISIDELPQIREEKVTDQKAPRTEEIIEKNKEI